MTDERDDWAAEAKRLVETYLEFKQLMRMMGPPPTGETAEGGLTESVAQALRAAFARGERRGLDTLHAEIAQLKRDKSSNDEAYLELSRENGLLKRQLWSRQEQL